MAGNDRPKVLVVDDEAELRELLSDALGPELDVALAASGREAIAAARRATWTCW